MINWAIPAVFMPSSSSQPAAPATSPPGRHVSFKASLESMSGGGGGGRVSFNMGGSVRRVHGSAEHREHLRRTMGSSALVPRSAPAQHARGRTGARGAASFRAAAGHRAGGNGILAVGSAAHAAVSARRRTVAHSPVARRATARQPPRVFAGPPGMARPPTDTAAARGARKLLFLDVDGVLNTEYCRPRDAIHSKLLKRLSEVVRHTGTKIVLSSTWRLHPQYRAKLIGRLESVGVDRLCVVDDTPSLPLRLGRWPAAESHRAEEIAAWLKGNNRADLVWCAVDDLDVTASPHAALFAGHFVRTSRESGLSEQCQAQLIRILGPRAAGD